MELPEAAKHLIKFSAVLGVILGLISVIFWLCVVLNGLSPAIFRVNIYDVFMLSISIIAVLLGYIVLTLFPERLEADPARNSVFLLLIGIVVAIGSWGVPGLLLAIGAILILFDETT